MRHCQYGNLFNGPVVESFFRKYHISKFSPKNPKVKIINWFLVQNYKIYLRNDLLASSATCTKKPSVCLNICAHSENLTIKKTVSKPAPNKMDIPLPISYIVICLISTTSGNHNLRGCQDIEPTCALVDEIRGDTHMMFGHNFHFYHLPIV